MRGFLGTVKAKLRRFSLSGEAAFINFPDGALSKKVHEKAYFGDNREKLRRVKETWDKDNFFHWAQGVQPKDVSKDEQMDEPEEEDLTDRIAGDQWESLVLTEVKLYGQVFYCDDSSSMKREGRWAAQRNLVERIARITTRLVPENKGVLLRFINQDVNKSSNLSFREIQDILESMSWHPSGDSQIGTYLRSKILKPMIYSKFGATKTFNNQLLISIITDGAPSQEKETDFEDAILECGDMLETAGYPRDSVKFLVSQVGTANAATRFLDRLKETMRRVENFAKVVYVTSDLPGATYKEFNENSGGLEEWLVENLLTPLIIHKVPQT